MIVILIATMGTAIIVGWMGNIDTPQSIGDVEIENVMYCEYMEADDSESSQHPVAGYYLDGFSIEIRDQDGNYLEGATVLVENGYIEEYDGEGKRFVRPVATTEGDGTVTFSPLLVDPPTGITHFDMHLTIVKTGYGEKSLEVMVVLN